MSRPITTTWSNKRNHSSAVVTSVNSVLSSCQAAPCVS
jgi:hypothetical protein